MITHIHIRDFAIVRELALELGPGMTALTGETGAGKSILIDALGFALGDRTDAGFVRAGQAKCEITATFSLDDAAEAKSWLAEQELGETADEEVILRRVITAEGRSKGFINGSPCPLSSLKQLGENLLDIHGQHEHQSLMKKDAQRQLLDNFAAHRPKLDTVAKLYRDWQIARTRLDELEQASADREDRLELLRYQVQELDALDLSQEEWQTLNAEHAQLANAGRLLQTCAGVLEQVYEGEQQTVNDQLSHATGELESLLEVDPRLSPIHALLSEALIQTQEAAGELRSYVDNLDIDPQRLEWVENRIGDVMELARKHRVEPDQLPEHHTALAQELSDLESSGETLDQLREELTALEQRYLAAAGNLTKGRTKAAKSLSSKVTAVMKELGMPNGLFQIEISAAPEGKYSPKGLDLIEFLVTANTGYQPRPLAKVASGGELSRISLAIQVITARSGGIPAMIFDEVDSGIGGGIAEVVGRELRTLGRSRQVLCVTHLPQVAAQAHAHLQVAKSSKAGMTQSGIHPLTEQARVDEIARMLGGLEMTEQTLAHAKEMIDRAQQTEH